MISLPTIIVIGVVVLLSTLCDCQLFQQWGRQAGGSFYDQGNGIAVDVNNNVYSVGSVSGYTTGNLIEGQSYGGADSGILIKYDSEGSRQWARLVTASSNYQTYVNGGEKYKLYAVVLFIIEGGNNV